MKMTPNPVTDSGSAHLAIYPDEIGGLIDAAKRTKAPVVTLFKSAKRASISCGFTTGGSADV